MLKRNSGHIVGVASMAGHFGIAGQVDYASSKFAARGLMEALSAEIRSMKEITGVNTTTICPGPVATPLFKGFGEGGSSGKLVLQPQQVAQAAVDAIEAGREGQAILPGWAFKPLLFVKAAMMAWGGYGLIDDKSDPMGTMDYTQANKLFGLMQQPEPVAARARL